MHVNQAPDFSQGVADKRGIIILGDYPFLFDQVNLMAKLSQSKVNQIFVKIKKELQAGSISLINYLDTIKQIIMKLSPKENQQYLKEYHKDKYSVGGLKPLPIPKNIKAFYHDTKIYFDPIKQLYFWGRPHKRSHGRLVHYQDLPKITINAQQFIYNKFFNS